MLPYSDPLDHLNESRLTNVSFYLSHTIFCPVESSIFRLIRVLSALVKHNTLWQAQLNTH